MTEDGSHEVSLPLLKEPKADDAASIAAILPVLLIATAILTVGLFLRTRQLTSVSFWFDEACSWRISQFPFDDLLDAVSRDAHPPLFYLVIKGWSSLFGAGVASYRSFSVVMGMATIIAAWWFVRTAVTTHAEKSPSAVSAFERLFTPLLAAFFVAVSAIQIELSLEARPYTLGTLFALIAGAFLLKAIHRPQRLRNWIGFAAASTALTFTHYYGLFTLAALLCYIGIEFLRSAWQTGWSSTTKSILIGFFVAVWLIQLAWIPWFSTFEYQHQRAERQLWMQPLDWTILATNVWKAVAGGKKSEVWLGWEWTAVVVWGLVSLSLFVRGSLGGRLAAIAALFPLLACAIYGLAVRNVLGVRYLLFAHVYLLVSLALWLGYGRFLPMRIAGILLVAVWLQYWTWQLLEHREFIAEFPGTRGAVTYLNNERRPDEPVVFSSPFVYAIGLVYLNNRTNVSALSSEDHRNNILSGPALKEADYGETVNLLSSKPETIWTVDAAGLFGGMSTVPMNNDYYHLVTEERFSERFGYRMDLLVRKYSRKVPFRSLDQ